MSVLAHGDDYEATFTQETRLHTDDKIATRPIQGLAYLVW